MARGLMAARVERLEDRAGPGGKRKLGDQAGVVGGRVGTGRGTPELASTSCVWAPRVVRVPPRTLRVYAEYRTMCRVNRACCCSRGA